MKFKRGDCVRTSDLDFQSYCQLITRLVSEGHHLVNKADVSRFFDMWDYVGVDQNSEIQLFDRPYSYLEINAWQFKLGVKMDEYPNIVKKEWLDEYLKF